MFSQHFLPGFILAISHPDDHSAANRREDGRGQVEWV